MSEGETGIYKQAFKAIVSIFCKAKMGLDGPLSQIFGLNIHTMYGWLQIRQQPEETLYWCFRLTWPC